MSWKKERRTSALQSPPCSSLPIPSSAVPQIQISIISSSVGPEFGLPRCDGSGTLLPGRMIWHMIFDLQQHTPTEIAQHHHSC